MISAFVVLLNRSQPQTRLDNQLYLALDKTSPTSHESVPFSRIVIWSLFFCVVIGCVMLAIKLEERSSEYAAYLVE